MAGRILLRARAGPSAAAMASQIAPTSESWNMPAVWFTTWYLVHPNEIGSSKAAFAHAAHGQ